MKTPLCKCNKCDTIYIDTNPQVGVAQFKAPTNTPTLTVQYDEFSADYFKGCPKCKTDGYLIDITENEDLTKEEQRTFKLV